MPFQQKKKQLTYYIQRFPYPTNGGNPPHLNLEGELRAFLDGVHLILANHTGQNQGLLDGVELEQSRLPFVLTQIDHLVEGVTRNVANAVPEAKTAQAIAALYKSEAHAIFAFYGRNQ
jgi:hypothetical protein